MSGGADLSQGGLPPEWTRLERSAEGLSQVVDRWTRRVQEAEDEVVRLRRSLEDVANENAGAESDDLAEELRRLKAENAALQSRMLQARKKVAGLMQRLSALEVDG
ncbi:MAG: hypothetical protein WD737_01445 [Gemmatimonadota bacterium]